MKLKSKERSGSEWAACYEKRMGVFQPIYEVEFIGSTRAVEDKILPTE
jgi:hypothetical protein